MNRAPVSKVTPPAEPDSNQPGETKKKYSRKTEEERGGAVLLHPHQHEWRCSADLCGQDVVFPLVEDETMMMKDETLAAADRAPESGVEGSSGGGAQVRKGESWCTEAWR